MGRWELNGGSMSQELGKNPLRRWFNSHSQYFPNIYSIAIDDFMPLMIGVMMMIGIDLGILVGIHRRRPIFDVTDMTPPWQPSKLCTFTQFLGEFPDQNSGFLGCKFRMDSKCLFQSSSKQQGLATVRDGAAQTTSCSLVPSIVKDGDILLRICGCIKPTTVWIQWNDMKWLEWKMGTTMP